MKLSQTITEETATGDIGTLTIQSADYSGGVLDATFLIETNDLSHWWFDPDGFTRMIRLFDRTRGQEIDEVFNLHLEDGSEVTTYEVSFSVAVPDDTRVEAVYTETASYVTDPVDGSAPDIRRFEKTLDVDLEIGNPGENDIVASIPDPETGARFVIHRAVADGDAGLVEAEVIAGSSGLEAPLADDSTDGIIRVATDVDRDDVVARLQLDELGPDESTGKKTVTFDNHGSSSATVSFIHHQIDGDLIGNIELTDGNISEPVSQLEPTEIIASQIGDQRRVQVDVTVKNRSLNGDGVRKSGLVEVYPDFGPSIDPEAEIEREVIGEVFIENLAPGEHVTQRMSVGDERLPAGEYEICARLA